MIVVVNHHENASKENEEKMEEVNDGFLSVMSNLVILKNSEKRSLENSFKWPVVLN